MPAVSVAQRRAAAMELKRREMGLNPQEFRDMTLEELRKLARTPEKGLPQRKRAKGAKGR